MIRVMEKVFEIATKISTPLVLAGVVIIALFFVFLGVLKKLGKPTRDKSPGILKLMIWALFGLGLISLFLGFVGYVYTSKNPLYRVRVTVLDPNNQLVKDAEVTSVPSGHQKGTDSGREIDIPDSVIAKDRKLRIWATTDGGIFRGSTEVELSDDYNPTVTIVLRHETSARIRGQVNDEDGNPISGISVYLQDYPDEKTTTDVRGHFDLPAHAAPNEYVHLFVEGNGYQAWNDVIPAGGESLATIVLTKKKRDV
jgi:hypothetical protein